MKPIFMRVTLTVRGRDVPGGRKASKYDSVRTTVLLNISMVLLDIIKE